MISLRSLQWFVLINGSLFGASSVFYFILQLYEWSVIPIFMVKNLLLFYTIQCLTNDKDFITQGYREATNISSILLSTSVEVCGYMLLSNYFSHATTSILVELLYFIPISFAFEVIFDLFHYITHRICHTSRFLYKYIHAIHHRSYCISAATAFQHHIVDLVLTNTLPLILTAQIIQMGQYSLFVFFWYKTWIEIGGHVGKHIGASSFPQCIWLPRYFHIELYSRDHERHHTHPNVNFSKRFSLWDRVFGTYSS